MTPMRENCLHMVISANSMVKMIKTFGDQNDNCSNYQEIRTSVGNEWDDHLDVIEKKTKKIVCLIFV